MHVMLLSFIIHKQKFVWWAVKKKKQIGPVQYLPPNTAVVAPVPSPSLTAQGSGSSVSTSTFDADDNDLTPNTVPQTPNVAVQQPKPVEQQVVVTQTVPQVVNVQKIKVRRPRPSTVCILHHILILHIVLVHLKKRF